MNLTYILLPILLCFSTNNILSSYEHLTDLQKVQRLTPFIQTIQESANLIKSKLSEDFPSLNFKRIHNAISNYLKSVEDNASNIQKIELGNALLAHLNTWTILFPDIQQELQAEIREDQRRLRRYILGGVALGISTIGVLGLLLRAYP